MIEAQVVMTEFPYQFIPRLFGWHENLAHEVISAYTTKQRGYAYHINKLGLTYRWWDIERDYFQRAIRSRFQF